MDDRFSHRRHVHENIDVQPWSVLIVEDGQQYLVKSYFNVGTSTSYDIMLYDGMDIWTESVDASVFKEKCKKYNPNIEANISTLLSHVERSLQNCQNNSSASVYKLLPVEVKLDVKSKIQAGISFHWTFVLKKCEVKTLNRQVVNPMFIMITELFRRQEELSALLERKDLEILDHQEQGSVVSRKHLQTHPFQRKIFQTTSNVDEEFLSNCQRSSNMSELSFPYTADLYRNVMLNTQETKSISQQTTHAPTATFDTVSTSSRIPEHVPSWSGRIPESIEQNNESVPCQPVDQDSPVKDIEQGRREALRKRLEDESERKSKKKKRKLNI